MPLNNTPEYESPFPNPWIYHDVPKEDMKDLIQMYTHNFLERPDTLSKAIEQVTYHPTHPFVLQHRLGRMTQGADATHAALFFVISDFIALHYARYHPKYKTKPIPTDVLGYLCPPFNQMISLDIEDQKRFRASLPPEQQEAVYIDD